MFLHNPRIVNLVNEKAGTHHPLILRESDTPSGPIGTVHRFKSKSHHTAGFTTREESIAECRRLADLIAVDSGSCKVFDDPQADLVWDGEGIPATVVWMHE